ncbi:MAG: GNAT family N-acetyltransferase [Bacteroidetes bacterium]|nr:GNAT family N-acetyltransferase [Bacteroidota bacterium]
MSPHEVRLIEATTHDASSIAKLAAHIWQQHYPQIIGQKQVDYMLSNMYSEPALLKQMQEGQLFYLIYAGEIKAGYIAVSQKEEGHYFLHKFYIDPSLQARGLGKAVFAATTALFPELKQWTLTVNRKNYKSVNFYFRLGFVIDKVADFDIGEGYFMEDFVMIWKSNG